jgi:hypothetical protein
MKMDRPDDLSGLLHWIYESPRMPGRARLRVYYTTQAQAHVVRLEALDIL